MKFNKNQIGWIFYDFANSSFTTIIVTVIYSIYFKNVVVDSAELGTALWGRAISISMVLVAISAPIFGAVADYSRAKKKHLFYFSYLCVIFTALLFFVTKNQVFKGMLFFIIANWAYNIALVFYNAFLPEISQKHNIGRISGYGWAFGYVGGLISLVIALPLAEGHIRHVFPTVALFYGSFSILTFYLLKEKKFESKRSNYFKIAYRRISHSVKNIKKLKELLKFFLSYFLFNEGIVSIIAFSSIYGATQFDMKTPELVTYFIVAQISSIIGATVFGVILDKIGAKKTLTITLSIWVLVIIAAILAQNKIHYYYVGFIAGIAIGSSQSSARTFMAQLTPKEKMTEIFGFFSLTGKLGTIFGPLVFGEISRITGSQRIGALSLLFFFISGGIFLQFVNEKKGLKDAEITFDEID